MSEPEVTTKRKRTSALESVVTKAQWVELMHAALDGKDQVILALGVLGLRATEIGACSKDWVDFTQQTIRVPATIAKRKKGRVIPYGKLKVVRDIITSFFMIGQEVGLSRIAVYQRIQRLATRAKLPHPLTVHGLRATGATWFAQAGYSITGLLSHFGWTEIRTAEHYIKATGASAMRDMERFGETIL